ncbi:prepilin peptidase [Micromonospora sp. DT227]|uniref:prepilin peptidase n=1 Tax=Micromonospora sp. DT227 TaxID=3393433 RepID=UPI003CF2D31E
MNPVIRYSALCGALASLTLPYAYARVMGTLGAGWLGPRGCMGGPCRWWRWWSPLACAAGAAASAGIAQLTGARPGGPLLVAGWLVVLYAGALLCMVDVAVQRLPTPVIGAAALALMLVLVGHCLTTGQAQTLIRAGLAAGALGGGYLLVAVLGGDSVGLGDVRLAALLGAALGALGWPTVFYGALLPYPLAVPEAVIRLALRRSRDLAFGPYLVVGAFLAVGLVRH